MMKSNINIYLEALKKEILPNNKRSDFLIRILENAINNPPSKGSDVDVHHIFPVSWGGPNDKENLVPLLKGHHFKVHQLLSEVTIDKDKKSSMIYAYWRMGNSNKYKIKNHKEYQKFQKEHSINNSIRSKNWWASLNEEEKDKINKKINETKENKSQEEKQKIINKTKETIRNKLEEEKQKIINKTKETKANKTLEQKAIVSKNISDAQKKVWANKTQEQKDIENKKRGEANKGKKRSTETKQKLREVNIGKTLSEETKQKLSKAKIGKPSPNKGKPNPKISKIKSFDLSTLLVEEITLINDLKSNNASWNKISRELLNTFNRKLSSPTLKKYFE